MNPTYPTYPTSHRYNTSNSSWGIGVGLFEVSYMPYMPIDQKSPRTPSSTSMW